MTTATVPPTQVRAVAKKSCPLETGDRLTRTEFERWYAATLGIDLGNNVTVRLDQVIEVQPDVLLKPERGRHTSARTIISKGRRN